MSIQIALQLDNSKLELHMAPDDPESAPRWEQLIPMIMPREEFGISSFQTAGSPVALFQGWMEKKGAGTSLFGRRK